MLHTYSTGVGNRGWGAFQGYVIDGPERWSGGRSEGRRDSCSLCFALHDTGVPRGRGREFLLRDGLRGGLVKTRHGHWSGIGVLSE
jgi:hypothetical protein